MFPVEDAERRLIVALDFADAGKAYAFWKELALPRAVAKIGLELLFVGGAELARRLSGEGTPVFVDAKLFDIPNTVERATAQIAGLGAAFLTVHAQDRATCEAAARGRAGTALKLLGITLLTSVKPEALPGQGIVLTAPELVLKRASFAAEAGCEGVVCSPLEAASLKAAFGTRLKAVCPGIRPAGGAASAGDQARIATPAEAISAGADYIVIGRPITQAADPAAAARAIVAEIAAALV